MSRILLPLLDVPSLSFSLLFWDEEYTGFSSFSAHDLFIKNQILALCLSMAISERFLKTNLKVIEAN